MAKQTPSCSRHVKEHVLIHGVLVTETKDCGVEETRSLNAIDGLLAQALLRKRKQTTNCLPAPSDQLQISGHWLTEKFQTVRPVGMLKFVITCETSGYCWN